MQTKHIRRYNKSKYKYQSYDDLERLGLGSWLKHNASWLAPVAGAGLAIGTAGLLAPAGIALGAAGAGAGAAAAGGLSAGTALAAGGLGASVGSSVGGAVTNNAVQDDALNAQNKQTAQQNAYNQVQQQFQNTQIQNPQQSYAPVARCGGRLKRKAVGGPLIDGENTRKLGDDNLIIPQPFIQRPPIFNLLSGDVVSMNEGRNWKSTSGKVATDFSPYYTIKRGKDTYTLTKDEYKKAKDIASDTINSTINQPSFAMGGTLNYEGQSHEGPDGGVPVDSMGNPNSTNPIALVEKGEVMYKDQSGQPYIFSDTLNLTKNKTFAKEAKSIQSKYKMRLGENMVGKNDPIAMKGYQKDMQELQQKQEDVRELNGMNDEETPEYRNGGGIHIKPENKGKFTAYKERTGKTTTEALHSKNAHVRQMANFARNARKWRKEMGGGLPKYWDGSTLPVAGENFNSRDLYQAPSPEETLINPTPYNNNYTATELGTGPDLSSDLYTRSQNINGKSVNELEDWKPYSGMGWESAVGLAAPIAGNIIGMIGNNIRRNKGRVQLDTSIQTPQNISLERERASAREQANLVRANTRRSLKGGTSAQQYMANVGANEIGIQRGLGQQLGESYQREEEMNANQRAQTASRQDRMKGLKLQTDMYNSQLDAQNAAQQQQYINNMINSVNQWGAEMSQSKQNALIMQMLNPNQEMQEQYTDPRNFFTKAFKGKRYQRVDKYKGK